MCWCWTFAFVLVKSFRLSLIDGVPSGLKASTSQNQHKTILFQAAVQRGSEIEHNWEKSCPVARLTDTSFLWGAWLVSFHQPRGLLSSLQASQLSYELWMQTTGLLCAEVMWNSIKAELLIVADSICETAVVAGLCACRWLWYLSQVFWWQCKQRSVRS